MNEVKTQYTAKDIINFMNEYKVTSFLFTMMAMIFIVFNLNYEFQYELAHYSVLMRSIISSFVHLDISHLLVNMLSFLTFRKIETLEGSRMYIYKIIYFVVMNALLIDSLNRFYRTNFIIGFSGVLFGLSTLYPRNYFFGFECDKKFYPFVLLLITQVFVPNASFVGHLSGIVSAYILTGVMNMRD